MKTVNRFKKSLLVTALAATALAAPLVASAIPVTPFQVTVMGTGDFTGINYNSGVTNGTLISTGLLSGGVGSFSIDTSFTNAPGNSTGSLMDSNYAAADLLGSAGGTITIIASGTNFLFPTAGSAATLFSSVGGTNSNTSITAQAWVDNTNTLGGMGSITTFQGPFSTTSFSNDLSTGFIAANPFSITQQIVITVGAGGHGTGDFSTHVPEPGSLALIGLGLLAAGALRRRKT